MAATSPPPAFLPLLSLSPNLHEPAALGRIEDHSVAGQPGLQDLDLELEEPDVGVSPRRPASFSITNNATTHIGRMAQPSYTLGVSSGTATVRHFGPPPAECRGIALSVSTIIADT
jgi:hypothetical protein